MLALKVLLVPGFLLALSVASRLLGPGIAGWLAGLPVVAGPILLVLALENGRAFAATAATASTAAVFASVSFSLAYAHTARRLGWQASVVIALLAWGAAAVVLALLPHHLAVAAGIALATLLVAPTLFPGTAPVAPKRLTTIELVLRMIIGATLTVAVSYCAAALGGTWSGLLTVFPVLGIVLAVFSHRSCGAGFAAALLRAMITGLYSFVAFCVTVAILLPSQPITISFGAAILVCISVQVATKKCLAPRPASADQS